MNHGLGVMRLQGRRWLALLLVMMAVFVAACEDETNEDDTAENTRATATVAVTEAATAAPTEAVTAAVTEAATEEATATRRPTHTATPEVTPETTPTRRVTPEITPPASPTQRVTPEVTPPGVGADVENISLNGLYVLTAQILTTTELPEDLPEPPDGTRWAMVLMSLNNFSDVPLDVATDALYLEDPDGNRYPVAEPHDTANNLIGITIPAQTPQQGYALFALPAAAEGTHVIWCVDADCDEALRSPIPLRSR
ncbi:MAG: hypothetical protein HC915_02635 [Anaerolineae bacterium]|nr:hypothetical protein [Anaerolineae bacterium]